MFFAPSLALAGVWIPFYLSQLALSFIGIAEISSTYQNAGDVNRVQRQAASQRRSRGAVFDVGQGLVAEITIYIYMMSSLVI